MSYKLRPSLDPFYSWQDSNSYGGDAPIWKWPFSSDRGSMILDRVINSIMPAA